MSTKSAPISAANLRRADVALDQLLDFGIAQNLLIAGDVELLVQNRMAIGDA